MEGVEIHAEVIWETLVPGPGGVGYVGDYKNRIFARDFFAHETRLFFFSVFPDFPKLYS